MSAAARATVAITARFHRQRVAGNPTMPILDYVTHRTELASELARVYAITALTEHVGRCYVHDHEDNAGTGDHDPEATSYAPWASSNRDRMLAKAIATETLESVAAASRRLCGAHGVLHANRISLYESMARSFHSVAGDNRLLLLEAGKHLLAHGPIAPPVPSQPGIGLGDDGSALQLVCLREQVLTERLRRHRHLDTDWNPHLLQLEELARVHATRRILEELGNSANSTGPPHEALAAVHRLHGLDTLLDSVAWHLSHGSMRPGDLDVLQRARAEAADEVHRHLDHLVDGLTVPPGRVGGFIGQDDYIHRVAAILP
ncbi:acyl-CoA dehydrogenase [Amycolatopsis lurida]